MQTPSYLGKSSVNSRTQTAMGTKMPRIRITLSFFDMPESQGS